MAFEEYNKKMQEFINSLYEKQECIDCKKIIIPDVKSWRGGEVGYRETLYKSTYPLCGSVIHEDFE